MKTNRSQQQTIETLSAYLDGQLTEPEMQLMRQQLEKDAALRNQLDDLRQTRYVLRQTPRLKRRRNFVLSPEMVKQQKAFFRAMNVSRAISAAASVLLVAALGSQYLLSGGMGLASAPIMDTANYEMVDEVAADDAADALPLMAMEAPEEEAAEEPAIDAPADEPAEAPMAETQEELGSAAVTETEAAASIMADEPTGDAENAADDPHSTEVPAGMGGEPPAAEVESDAVPSATLEGNERSAIPEKDADGVQDELLPHKIPAEEQAVPAEELISDRPLAYSPLQVAQGVLLLLAIAGGLSAAYFRKKVR